MWQWNGERRPPWAVEPGPDQESVWDYPRPPRLERVSRPVRVELEGLVIARSDRAWRVCETASPPVYYLPPEDLERSRISPAPGASFCEWKGQAVYWAVEGEGHRVEQAGWSYPRPTPAFAAIRDFLSFYPGRLECYVGGDRVAPQPGGFYGGWVTPELVGPWKGEPGTGGW